MTLYLDSSVLVAALSPESFSRRALSILTLTPQVIISELTVTETRVSLTRKRKRGAMTGAEVAAALSALAAAIDDGTLSVAPLPVAAFREAEAIADRVSAPVRAMDALHVAMAAALSAELATFDDDQALAARAEGITTVSG